MSNMINFGNGLQKKYSGSTESDILTNSQRKQQKSDHEALREASRAKRKAREERSERRQMRLDNNNPEIALEKLEKDPTKDLNVKHVIDEAKAKTNEIARAHGLAEPNNPEAMARDRLHCMMCNRKLDSPNNYKRVNNGLFEDEEVRTMCCWCFGKMSDSDIKSKIETKEATAEVRLQVYNPEESTKAEVESLIESKKIQLKSKLRRWKQDTALVGNVKHDYLVEGDQFENQVQYRAKTRYTACTW